MWFLSLSFSLKPLGGGILQALVLLTLVSACLFHSSEGKVTKCFVCGPVYKEEMEKCQSRSCASVPTSPESDSDSKGNGKGFSGCYKRESEHAVVKGCVHARDWDSRECIEGEECHWCEDMDDCNAAKGLGPNGGPLALLLVLLSLLYSLAVM